MASRKEVAYGYCANSRVFLSGDWGAAFAAAARLPVLDAVDGGWDGSGVGGAGVCTGYMAGLGGRMKNRWMYPDNWDELALACKEQAGWCCEHCGIGHGELAVSERTGVVYTVYLAAAHLDH